MKDYKVKKGCKYCKHNRERTVNQKECKKRHRAVYGFGCRDYEPKEVNKYEIGYQLTIYDIMNDIERRNLNE